MRGRAAPDWVGDGATRSRAERRVLSRDEWVDVHGADDADLNAIVEFARNSGLEAVSVDSARRAVVLRGTVDAVTGAFEAGLLGLFEHPSGVQYRGRQGPLTVPAELDGIVTGVFGIDDRPQAQPRIRFAVEPGTSYSPVQVGQAYSFPPGATGVGETVGIIELGGGYDATELTDLLRRPRADAPERQLGQRRRRHELARRRHQRRWRGDARHRGRRLRSHRARRSSSTSPRTPTRAFSTRSRSPCTTRPTARRCLDQLGRPGGLVDVAGPGADGGDADRRRRTRRHGHVRGRRWRLDRRRGRRPTARRLSRLGAARAGVRRDLAAGVSRPITDETVWNDAERRDRRRRQRRVRAAELSGAGGRARQRRHRHPRSRRPGCRRRRRPADRLPDPRRRRRPGGRRHERGRTVVGRSGRLAERVARVTARFRPTRGSTAPRAFTTSRAATTAPTTPAQAGTRAPASALPTARRCCRPCREARAGSGEPPLAPPVTTTALASAPRALANGREQRPDVRRHV